MDRLVYSVPEAAEVLDIGTTLAWELVARCEIESIKIGNSRKIPADALTAYIQRRLQAEQLATEPA
jgi:excisionase family DNA binding protein